MLSVHHCNVISSVDLFPDECFTVIITVVFGLHELFVFEHDEHNQYCKYLVLPPSEVKCQCFLRTSQKAKQNYHQSSCNEFKQELNVIFLFH